MQFCKTKTTILYSMSESCISLLTGSRIYNNRMYYPIKYTAITQHFDNADGKILMPGKCAYLISLLHLV